MSAGSFQVQSRLVQRQQLSRVSGGSERERGRGDKNKLKSPLTLKRQRCPAWTLTLSVYPLLNGGSAGGSAAELESQPLPEAGG